MIKMHGPQGLRGLGIMALLLSVVGCAGNRPVDESRTAAVTPKAKPQNAPIIVKTKPTATGATLVLAAPVSPGPVGKDNAETLNDAPAPANNGRDNVSSDREQANYEDLWDRIRAGFALPRMEGPYVAQHERWFVNNTDYMERMLQRANLYLYHIVEEVEKRGIPMEIALLPAIESAYKPNAYSHARASGLWQFIPSTGRLYGLKRDGWYDGRRDVLASTRAALDYLEKLNKEFNGDWYLALAAYNAGEGRIGRAIAQNRRQGLSTSYEYLSLPSETRHYVPKLMAIVNIVANPERYGLDLREIPNSPYFVKVDAGGQIDLGVVAKLTNLPIDDVYAMNPGYSRWATSPNGPHNVLVPVDAKEAFLAALSELPPEERLQWARHEVRRGETISRVAQRFGVSVAAIRETNNLSSNRLRAGQDLLIPVSGRKLIADAKSSTKVAKATATAPEGRMKVVHRVRRGETLYSIARRYNVYVDQLTKWNVMGKSDVLRMGQRLKIWVEP